VATHDSPETQIWLQFTGRQWASIDAVMDGAACDAVASMRDSEPFRQIRHAGWNQLSPPDAPARPWPPGEEIVAISLRSDQWDLVAAQLLEQDRRLSDHLPIRDEENLRLLLDAQAAVRAQLHPEDPHGLGNDFADHDD
jgi:hypothetical protein